MYLYRPKDRHVAPLAPEIRKAEHEVDNAYKANGVMGVSRPQAVWQFLTTIEQPFLRLLDPNLPRREQQAAALADGLNNWPKWPMRWIFQRCSAGASYVPRYSAPLDASAAELLDLGKRYLDYEVAFTYATQGLVNLRMKDTKILPDGPTLWDTRWDAYDRIEDGLDRAPDYGRSEYMMVVTDVVGPAVRLTRNGVRLHDDT